MLIKWEAEHLNKSASNNIFGIITTNYCAIHIKAYLFVSVPFFQYGGKRFMHVRLYFKTSNDEIEHIYHDVSDSCFEFVEKLIGEKNCLLQPAFFEYYPVNRFPKNIPFSFGDYSIN